MSSRRAARGFSLVEVVVFIIVLGVGLAGILVLFNQVTRGSVDPVVRKQALAIASSLLEEIQLRAFTYCDPDDAAVHTAAGPGDCAVPELMPPATEPGEAARAAFDNVNDYHGFQMGSGTGNPISTAGGAAVDGVADYHVAAAVAVSNLGTIGGGASLLVTVTATHVPTSTVVTLQGYRTRYAPNQP